MAPCLVIANQCRKYKAVSIVYMILRIFKIQYVYSLSESIKTLNVFVKQYYNYIIINMYNVIGGKA